MKHVFVLAAELFFFWMGNVLFFLKIKKPFNQRIHVIHREQPVIAATGHTACQNSVRMALFYKRVVAPCVWAFFHCSEVVVWDVYRASSPWKTARQWLYKTGLLSTVDERWKAQKNRDEVSPNSSCLNSSFFCLQLWHAADTSLMVCLSCPIMWFGYDKQTLCLVFPDRLIQLRQTNGFAWCFLTVWFSYDKQTLCLVFPLPEPCPELPDRLIWLWQTNALLMFLSFFCLFNRYHVGGGFG